MNVLFLSLLDFNDFSERNVYSDLLREFIKDGHSVYCVSPVEKRKNQDTHLLSFGNNQILKLKIGNTQKVNLIEKGISTLLIEPLFIKGIKEYFSDVKFDFVLYATPPITFAKVIRFIKKRDGARSYLMLKDIFPQNSVDLKILSTTGIKGRIYSYFRRKEKKLYALSDRIGCMSKANVDYLLRHNREISPSKVEICLNCIDVRDVRLSENERIKMRDKYGIPHDKKVFVYGGNLGKPQGVPFIIDCLKKCADNKDAFFIIAGKGTDRYLIEKYINKENPQNIMLLDELPKEEYDEMIAGCDIGLIFLDYRFTVPNFPSRLLSYMQAGLPVLACTDSHTDVGKVIVDGGFGWWCSSDNSDRFSEYVSEILKIDTTEMSENAVRFLTEHYDSSSVYSNLKKYFND